MKQILITIDETQDVKPCVKMVAKGLNDFETVGYLEVVKDTILKNIRTHKNNSTNEYKIKKNEQ